METHTVVHRYSERVRHRQTIGSAERWRNVASVAPSTQELLDHMTRLARDLLDVAAVCLSLVDIEGQPLTSSYGS